LAGSPELDGLVVGGGERLLAFVGAAGQGHIAKDWTGHRQATEYFDHSLQDIVGCGLVLAS
jgi:hypothetical protein